jgi:predicted site-specific integrase-resolvase
MSKEDLIKGRQEKGFFTIEEISKRYGINRYSVDIAINSGKLPFMTPNNKTRFIKEEDFESYMRYSAQRIMQNQALAKA